MPDFSHWLDLKLNALEWNDSRLAKEAGFNQSVISKARGGTGPGVDACISIANAMHVPVVEVLVAAGHIPRPPDWTPKLEEAATLFSQMTEPDQDDFLAFMRRRVERGQRDEKQAS